MNTYVNIHVDKTENFHAEVRRSLEGNISLSFGGNVIFCTPEQAMKFATQILNGTLNLPPEKEESADKAEAAEQETDMPCPF